MKHDCRMLFILAMLAEASAAGDNTEFHNVSHLLADVTCTEGTQRGVMGGRGGVC